MLYQIIYLTWGGKSVKKYAKKIKRIRKNTEEVKEKRKDSAIVTKQSKRKICQIRNRKVQINKD